MNQRLTVGIALTTEPQRSRVQLDEFCGRLAEATGLAVEAHGVWPYHRLLEALQSGDIGMVWLPPLLALRATASSACVPIALPLRQGVSTYSSALFTRAQGGLAELAALRGSRVGWVDKQSAAGYLVIRAWLRKQGLDLSTTFKKELFLGSHRAVVEAVSSGEVDVGATFAYFETPDAEVAQRAGWGDESVRVLGRVDAIPSDIVAVAPNLGPEVREKVQTALVAATNSALMESCRSLMGASAFVAPKAEHLNDLLALLDGLDKPPRASQTNLLSRD